ncbi:MAG: hypothetical protein K5761_07345 [Clostridiales bacterium]|nr:hypothetical protein [Clostridiales bacterium]
MMTITEKVAHLKGLVEGMELADSKETKVLNEILDVLEDIAFTVSDLDDEVGLITEQLDEVDEDLADLEDCVYEDYDDECGCGCGHDQEMYEVECPNCHELVYFNAESILDGAAECPSCGQELEFDLEETEEEETEE